MEADPRPTRCGRCRLWAPTKAQKCALLYVAIQGRLQGNRSVYHFEVFSPGAQLSSPTLPP